MKVSMLCGAHYEGAEAYLRTPPVAPSECDPEIAQQTFDHSLDYAALADELGFDWVSVSEHHYSPLILAPSLGPLAGALTQVVRRAKIALLGPLMPINNPVRAAEEIAMLDQLSHGRLIVLPLRGTPVEFRSYVPVEVSKTHAMTQEATLLIQKALTEPESFAWNGEHYHYPTIAVWPRAFQRPFPPMYFSGNSPSSATFAAREHLGVCLSFHRPGIVGETVATYRAEAASAGWEPAADHIVYRNYVVVADTPQRAAELEAVFLPERMRYLLDGPLLVDAPVRSTSPEQANGADGPFLPHRMLFAGTPDVLVERIRAFQEMTGVGVLDLIFGSGQLSPADVRRSIELFGREVLPRIRDLGGSTSGTSRIQKKETAASA